jgi:hypothetical protein
VKKKILNVLMLACVAAVLALNAHVVMSDGDSPILKWDVIGKVLATGTSGSGQNYRQCHTLVKNVYGGGHISKRDCKTCLDEVCATYKDKDSCLP